MTPAALGVDSGSTTCKVVAVDAGGGMLDWRLEAADPRIEVQSQRMVEELSDGVAVPVVATGYGRKLVRAATKVVTEITCHARGVFRELDREGTLVDVGGQDSKVIVLDAQGRVADFAMNDKCAAGTGRFLEHAAAHLGVTLDELGPRSLAGKHETKISSTCTVFAESEIISLLAHGEEIDPILRGLHRSLTSRIGAMVRSVRWRPPLMLSGGVARNAAFRELLAETLAENILLPRHPQLMGAYGAALHALGLRA